MDNLERQSGRSATPYRCSNCARCFLALGEVAASEILCACGARLSPLALPRGIYELRSPVPDDARPAAREHTPIPEEQDVGYGASHGHDPTHGGPTGPGDAPSSVTEGAGAGSY
jgi:hypothetical protein